MRRISRRFRRPLSMESMEQRLVLATYVVDTPFDNNDGNISAGEFALREAIELANSNPGPDTIEFDMGAIAGGQLLLTLASTSQSALVVSDPLTITGPGSADLTIDASPLDPTPNSADGLGRRILDSSATLTIEGVTLTGGDVNGRGGALRSSRGFNLDDVTITRNFAEWGGGISHENNFSEPSTIHASEISENQGTFRVGGIFNNKSSNLIITDSTIANNDGRFLGGGIHNYGSGLEVIDSVVTGNTASNGGGILHEADVEYSYYYNPYTGYSYYYYSVYYAQATVRNSSVSGNQATNGGGMFVGRGTYTDIAYSTLDGNYASSRGGGVQFDRPSGIYPIFFGGSATITSSTVSGNTAGIAGAGIADTSDSSAETLFVEFSTITNNYTLDDSGAPSGAGMAMPFGASANIQASIVAENFKYQGYASDILDGSSSLTVSQSLIGSSEGTSLSPSYLPDADGNLIGGVFTLNPGLQPLAHNGGPTQTHQLEITSIARDMVTGSAPQFDQRGFARQFGPAIDMGAFELNDNDLIDGDFNDDGLYNCTDIDALVEEIATGGANVMDFDLTGDMVVDSLDIDAWLAEAGAVNLASGNPYLHGDINLDGFVDGLDFIVWNDFKFTNTAAWCAGDVTADGFVDGQDFIVWNNNKFQASLVAPDGKLPPTEMTEALSPTIESDTQPIEVERTTHRVRELASGPSAVSRSHEVVVQQPEWANQ